MAANPVIMYRFKGAACESLGELTMADKLSFSIIGEITPELRQLLSEFEQIRHNQNRTDDMSWERAWGKLVDLRAPGTRSRYFAGRLNLGAVR